jgi:hypothetical protein
MAPPHNTATMPLKQQLLRSLAEDGRHMRLAVSNDSASDWLIRVGPLAKRLNEESRNDPSGDAA